MTLEEANEILSGQLFFGNEQQIAALAFLEKAKELGVCGTCEGSGQCVCDSCGATHDCGGCDGEGFNEPEA